MIVTRGLAGTLVTSGLGVFRTPPQPTPTPTPRPVVLPAGAATGDVKTLFLSFERGADYAIDALGLNADDGLETAVILSLFSDRLAEPGDSIPDGTADRRGWWADVFADVPADKIGSRLWLLHREKQVQSVVNRAREYAQEALAWLVEDGVAKTVSVTAEIVRTGVLGLVVEITRPNKTVSKYRFDNFWKSV